MYSTYLGGGYQDQGDGIALDSQGIAYITGYTDSADFPVTAGAFQTTFGGFSDVFVSKLHMAGATIAETAAESLTATNGNDRSRSHPW